MKKDNGFKSDDISKQSDESNRLNECIDEEVLTEFLYKEVVSEGLKSDFEINDEESEEEDKKHGILLEKLQRTMADFDNFRKRTSKEKSSMYNDGVRDSVEKFLPIIDNFQRAMDSVEKADDSFYKGIELILRQFLSLLNDIGIEEIMAKGEKFDHNVHFAVAHVDDEAFGENEVMEVLQKGYKYKDKVIRHSMVKVAN